MRLHLPKTAAVLALVSLVSGCSLFETESEPSRPSKPDLVEPSPAYWNHAVATDGEALVITDSMTGIDDRDPLTMEDQLLDQIMHDTMVRRVRDVLRDDEQFASHAEAIDSYFVKRWRRYALDFEVLKRGIFDDETKLGLTVRIRIDDDRLKRDLQIEGILRLRELRAAIVVRQSTSANAATFDDTYLDDLAQDLSGELVTRGLRPVLWNDVRRSVLERREGGDQLIDSFLSKYVEESDWRIESDERYALPMVLLRSEARLLIGYTIQELERTEGVYDGTVRVDAYDLLNQTSVGRWTESGRVVIGDRSLLQTRQALVDELSDKATRALALDVGDFLRREERLREREYRLTFSGYGEDDLVRISSLLAGIVTEDISPRTADEVMTVTCGINRAEIPTRDEILRGLQILGLDSRIVRADGPEMTFSPRG